MKIIILGAGQVGASLAKSLIDDQHDVTMVDRDEDRLNELQERIDLRTVCGSCSYPNILRAAGAQEADMLIALTNSDEANMIACQVAYSLFHVPKKIARIRSPHYLVREELFDPDHVPIDVFISPEQIVTRYISQLIAYPGALQVLDFSKGAAKLVVAKPSENTAALGLSLAEFYQALSATPLKVVAIYRQEESVLLSDETKISPGDEIFFITANKHVAGVMKYLYPKQTANQRIMIGGASHIGSYLARTLDDTYQVKVIDQDKRLCERLSERLDNGTVLLGEISDKALLHDENVEHVDAFCALTNDDEANIIACLQAKRLGARQVMALIARTAYIDLMEAGAINIAISPELLTAGFILAELRQGDIINVHSLRHGEAEAIEIVAHGDANSSRVVGRLVDDIRWPVGARMAAVIRDEVVLIAAPDLRIEANDHVIVFLSNKKKTRDLERLFQVSAIYF